MTLEMETIIVIGSMEITFSRLSVISSKREKTVIEKKLKNWVAVIFIFLRTSRWIFFLFFFSREGHIFFSKS